MNTLGAPTRTGEFCVCARMMEGGKKKRKERREQRRGMGEMEGFGCRDAANTFNTTT